LWNDTTYVEAARFLAERTIREGGQSTEERLRWLFRVVTARLPDAEETRILTQALERLLKHYRMDRAAAEKLLSVGESPRDVKLEITELAAYCGVAGMVLNLDEVLCKE
jgi:hypothetical protein